MTDGKKETGRRAETNRGGGLTRRQLLTGGTTLALTGFLAGEATSATAAMERSGKVGGVGGYGDHGSSLRDLPRLRSSRRKRASSWDRSGGNDDRLTIDPGQAVTLADIPGAGCVNHVWITADTENTDGEPNFLRKLLLKMYWDREEEPSVLVPLADLFGTGQARTVDFASAPLQMSPEEGKSFNCFFHMPFACGARIEVTSKLESEQVLFY
jgi:hypothetical protein